MPLKNKILSVCSLLILINLDSWDTSWRYRSTHGFQRESTYLTRAGESLALLTCLLTTTAFLESKPKIHSSFRLSASHAFSCLNDSDAYKCHQKICILTNKTTEKLNKNTHQREHNLVNCCFKNRYMFKILCPLHFCHFCNASNTTNGKAEWSIKK